MSSRLSLSFVAASTSAFFLSSNSSLSRFTSSFNFSFLLYKSMTICFCGSSLIVSSSMSSPSAPTITQAARTTFRVRAQRSRISLRESVITKNRFLLLGASGLSSTWGALSFLPEVGVTLCLGGEASFFFYYSCSFRISIELRLSRSKSSEPAGSSSSSGSMSWRINDSPTM